MDEQTTVDSDSPAGAPPAAADGTPVGLPAGERPVSGADGAAGQSPLGVVQTPPHGLAEHTDAAEQPGLESDRVGAVSVEVLTRLENRLDETLRLAQRRDELVDRLHKENQQLRQGELQTAMLPLLRDLMRLHDDLERIIAVDPGSQDTVLIRDALADALARNGITQFAPGENDSFDSALHAAVGAEPTDDPQSDRTICAVRRAGFRREDGSIVRVADVTVRKYRSGSPPESGSSPLSESAATGTTASGPPRPTDPNIAGASASNIDNERN